MLEVRNMMSKYGSILKTLESTHVTTQIGDGTFVVMTVNAEFVLMHDTNQQTSRIPGH